MPLFLVQHDQHIGAQTKDCNDAASKKKGDPAADGNNGPNKQTDNNNDSGT